MKLDLLSTIKGSALEDFFPAGWDLARMDALAGRAQARIGGREVSGRGGDARAAAPSWYAPESQRRDGGAQSARQELARAAAQAWPPA